MAVAGLEVREVVVRPVYGEEVSGIRKRDLFTVFPQVLAIGFGRRMRRALEQGGPVAILRSTNR